MKMRIDPPQVCLVVLLLFAVGCKEPAGSIPVSIGGVPPRHVVDLPVASEVPLEPTYLSVNREGVVAFAHDQSTAVWTMDLYSPLKTLRQLASISSVSGAPVRGLSFGGGHLGVLSADGWLSQLDPATGLEREIPKRLIPFSLGVTRRAMQLFPSPNGFWYAFVEEMHGDRGEEERRSVLTLYGIGRDSVPPVRVWERERWDLSTMVQGLVDRISATATGAVVSVSGSEPPRVESLELEALELASSTVTALEHGPVRMATVRERKSVERSIMQLPEHVRKSLPALDRYPPVLGAWPVGESLLVLAGAADRSVALDVYCHGAFTGTLMQDVSFRGAFVTPTGWLVVLQRTLDVSYRLLFFELGELTLDC
jgi:hypothetical protein